MKRILSLSLAMAMLIAGFPMSAMNPYAAEQTLGSSAALGLSDAAVPLRAEPPGILQIYCGRTDEPDDMELAFEEALEFTTPATPIELVDEGGGITFAAKWEGEEQREPASVVWNVERSGECAVEQDAGSIRFHSLASERVSLHISCTDGKQRADVYAIIYQPPDPSLPWEFSVVENSGARSLLGEEPYLIGNRSRIYLDVRAGGVPVFDWLTKVSISYLLVDPSGCVKALKENQGEFLIQLSRQSGEFHLVLFNRGRDDWEAVHFLRDRSAMRLEINRHAPDVPVNAYPLTGTVVCYVDRERQYSWGDPEIQDVRGRVTSSDEGVVMVKPVPGDNSIFMLSPVAPGEADITYQDGENSAHARVSVSPDVVLRLYNPQSGRPVESGQAPYVLRTEETVTLEPGIYVADVGARITSSNESIVAVERRTGKGAVLVPKAAGNAIIRYRDGCFYSHDVQISSQPSPGAGLDKPGFYAWEGGTPVALESAVIGANSQLGELMVYTDGENPFGVGEEPLEETDFSFSTPGIAQLVLQRAESGQSLSFRLYPIAEGETTLAYSGDAGRFELDIRVEDTTYYDFVIEDPESPLGWRLWDTESFLTGEDAGRRRISMAKVHMRVGELQSFELTPEPLPYGFFAFGAGVYYEGDADGRYYRTVNTAWEGTRYLIIFGQIDGVDYRWEKQAIVSPSLSVEESSIDAINRAIREVKIIPDRETVVMLPEGVIPGEAGKEVELCRPVTLRGNGTVLESGVHVTGPSAGAKLQNLTLRGTTETSRGIGGNGDVTVMGCTLEEFPVGVSMQGRNPVLLGKNIFRRCGVGLELWTLQGRRGTAQGLVFESNDVAVRLLDGGSRDPYFFRLRNSNFMGNGVNFSSFSPEGGPTFDFANNYLDASRNSGPITDYPRYERVLDIQDDGRVLRFPNRVIPVDQSGQVDVLNFEADAPIDASRFGGGTEICVKELGGADVGAAEDTSTLVRWRFDGSATESTASLFRPDVELNIKIHVAEKQLERYQGIDFSHSGLLPAGGATVSVRREKVFDSETLFVYRVNGDKLEFVAEIENSESGYLEFFLDHCSQYVITNTEIIEPEDDDAEDDDTKDDDAEDDDTKDDDTEDDDAKDDDTEIAVPEGERVEGDVPAEKPGASINAGQYVSSYEMEKKMAESGDTLDIDVSMKTLVSGRIFELLLEHPEKTVALHGDGYVWRFRGDELRPDAAKMITFNTGMNWDAENAQAIQDAAGGDGVIPLHFEHHGPLPGTAHFTLDLRVDPPEEQLNVYCFDEEQSMFELVARDRPVQNGRVSWAMEHCSDYVLSSKELEEAKSDDPPPAAQKPNPSTGAYPAE